MTRRRTVAIIGPLSTPHTQQHEVRVSETCLSDRQAGGGSECEIGCRRYQKKLSVVFQPVRTIDRGVGGGEMMTGGRGPIIGLHAPLRASCDASLSLLHLASERAHVRIALKSAAFAPCQLSHRSSVPAGRWLQSPILTRALAASCFASPASKCMAHTYKHAIASCVT